ncbi:hypothetical protein BST24_12555 [Mycobacteroides franklinii]|nr:hypothetical protein BST24_12555 [Mycobacteroides franklinii]
MNLSGHIRADRAAEGDGEVPAATIQRRWSPETQFIGALMWLTAARAKPVLDLVLDSDIEDPLNAWAIQSIRKLVRQGETPNPALVIRAAINPASDSQWSPADTATPGHRYHRFTLHIFNAYEHALPGASTTVLSYAREVLDDSYRRAFRVNGTRMIGLADAMADREDLTDFATELRTELAAIWRRTEQLNRLINTAKETPPS